MLKNLRVHISPFGYEVRRVVDPLLQMHADKAYLIGYEPDDSAKKYHDRIRQELDTHKNIEVVDVFVDMWDVYACIEKYREIIRKEEKNHIYINVSTGSKITAVAGMLSCMIWKGRAEPYYAYASEYRAVEVPNKKVEKIDSLPVYGISKPRAEELLVLKLLKENGDKMKKWKLIESLERLQIIIQKQETNERGERKEFTLSAKHSQLRAILGPMQLSLYVQVEGSGKRSQVVLSQQGRDALRIFGS